MTDQEFSEQVDMLNHLALFFMKGNPNLPREQALRKAGQRLSIDSEVIEKVIHEENEQIRLTTAIQFDRGVATDMDAISWYLGPHKSDSCWNQYRQKLESRPGMKGAVKEIDEQSTAIVNALANPRTAGQKKKGLVLGYVQSGKTANYAAVIAKAVDAGYRFIIVLAGMHTNLRQQTQKRLHTDLGIELPLTSSYYAGERIWHPLTHVEHEGAGTGDADMKRLRAEQSRGLIRPTDSSVFLAVLKKNSSRLAALVKMLKDSDKNARLNFPILIIDDESDQATPNTRAPQDDISAINKRVREIWSEVGTGTYVAYTATPFANLLVDPDNEADLYPSDFFVPLAEPSGYYGTSAYFGVGMQEPTLDAIRDIPEEDFDRVTPNREDPDGANIELTDSLATAIDWYLLATAIRRTRGHSDHSTMLVHTSMRVGAHSILASEIRDYLAKLNREMTQDSVAVLSRFKKLFETEHLASKNDNQQLPDSWTIVRESLEIDVIRNIEVREDNAQSEARLSYPDTGQLNVIVVGGNTLSRGLTLEGLICSYFARLSGTYDTLLQMGRWFGFRPGYEDLVRVWVGPGMRRDFNHIAMVEQDLREVALTMAQEGKRPADIGVRIRVDPGRLNVTAPNKMYFAEYTQVSLSDKLLQTHMFSLNKETLESNQYAVNELISQLPNKNIDHAAKSGLSKHIIYRDIDSSSILDFLEKFHFHETLVNLQPNVTCAWLNRFAPDAKWNVVIVSSSRGTQYEVSPGVHIGLTNRSKIKGSLKGDYVSIKALVAPSDLSIDLPKICSSMSVKEMKDARKELLKGNGLLLIYLIDKDSSPSGYRSVSREALEAPTHVPAIGLLAPEPTVNILDDHDYISVRPSNPQDMYFSDQDAEESPQ